MEFLVGDDTGLLKSVSTLSKCTYTYRTRQQDRKEAIRTACWSKVDSNGNPLEVTVGRRSGLVEALELPAPPLSVVAELRNREKSSPMQHGQTSFQKAPHYAPLSALSQSVRPRRALWMPSGCVQVSTLHKPDARSLLSASLLDFLRTDPYFCRFNCAQSSPLLPSSSPYLPCCSASSNPQLFCLGEEGHACVVDWEDDFCERIAAASPEGLETDRADGEAGAAVCCAEEPDEEEEEENVSSDCTHGFSLFEIAFPQVHTFQYPAAPSVSGFLRSVRPSGSAKRKPPGCSTSSSASSTPHIRGAWHLSAPVHCATPVNPLMPDRFAFGGKGNGVKVFDLSQGRYVWASKNVKQTLLQLQVSVHFTSLAWLSSIHPLLLAAGTARGAVRLFDLRCQRRPVYEVENATRGSYDVKESRVISAMVGEEVQLYGPGGVWSLPGRACEKAQTETRNGNISGCILQSEKRAMSERDIRSCDPCSISRGTGVSSKHSGAEARNVSGKEKPVVSKKRKISDKMRLEEAETATAVTGGEPRKCSGTAVKREKVEGELSEAERDTMRTQVEVKAEAGREGGGDPREAADSREWTAQAKAEVRAMYGQTRAKLYFADSLGAVYVHTVLTEDALLRRVDRAIKKHNRTSCCTTLSEEEDLEAEAGKRVVGKSSKRTSPYQSHVDTRKKNSILLAFREREEAKLSSKKNSCKRCTSPLNGPQYGSFFTGGFKGAMGAVTALAADVSGQYLVGVGYGRHAYIWQAFSRKLVAKVYLKQKLLAILPGTQVPAEAVEEPRRKHRRLAEDSRDSDKSTGEEDTQSSLGTDSEGEHYDGSTDQEE